MAEINLRVTDKIAWLLSKPKRIKIAVGGRGSSKSIGVGDLMLMFCDNGERICCSREFQNSIDDSVHESLTQEVDRLGVDGFKVAGTEIRSSAGGRIFYKGLARNITSLKSLAGVHRLWIEEGESVSERSLKVLTPSIRSGAGHTDDDPPEIWITMNRASSADAIAKKYLSRADKDLMTTGYYEDDMMMAVEVNWRDNPWFPVELEQERNDDYENLSREEYDHIWEGHYNDSIENSIIKPEWFDAAIDAHKHPRLKEAFEPRGIIKAAHDPSDTGRDSKGLAVLHGSIFKRICEKTDGEIDEGCDWAMEIARREGADWFIWDGDGMGAGLKGQVSAYLAGTRIGAHMFRGSLSGKGQDFAHEVYMPSGRTDLEPTTYAQTFFNNRAQYYVELARRFHNTWKCIVRNEYINPDDMISIASDGVANMPILRAEVCRVPKKRNPNGLQQIMSKDDMKKLGIESPNMSDSMMMCLSRVPDYFYDEEDEDYEDDYADDNRNANTGY